MILHVWVKAMMKTVKELYVSDRVYTLFKKFFLFYISGKSYPLFFKLNVTYPQGILNQKKNHV